jgi:hypothetical protein
VGLSNLLQRTCIMFLIEGADVIADADGHTDDDTEGDSVRDDESPSSAS